jgi:hypothetical protein
LFEFAAISDAKEFSFEDLDTWKYYIPEERQQADSDSELERGHQWRNRGREGWISQDLSVFGF